jgi:hypothetical protein
VLHSLYPSSLEKAEKVKGTRIPTGNVKTSGGVFLYLGLFQIRSQKNDALILPAVSDTLPHPFGHYFGNCESLKSDSPFHALTTL